jgi:hypothetical protein
VAAGSQHTCSAAQGQTLNVEQCIECDRADEHAHCKRAGTAIKRKWLLAASTPAVQQQDKKWNMPCSAEMHHRVLMTDRAHVLTAAAPSNLRHIETTATASKG